MNFYKLFLLFLVMILAFPQDAVGDSSLAGTNVVTTTRAVVGSFGSELYTMIETIASIFVSPGATFDGLQLAKSTVYASYTNVVTTTVLPRNTSTNVITVNSTFTAISTSTLMSTVTAVTTISPLSSSMVTGLCYVSAQDALTPCTAGVIASATNTGSAKSSSSATSGVMRQTPNGLFKALAFLKRRVIGDNHNQKRSTNCNGWQAAIIITALTVAFTMMSILLFATFLREKKEDYPRLNAYKLWVYGAQVALLALLIWLIVWSAMKTVGNGCN